MYPFINDLSDHDARIVTLTDISTPIQEQSHYLEKLMTIQLEILYTC